MNRESVPVPATAVVGLQFGDEGKGQIADHLVETHDVIVRFNGGANAGHSVRIGDEKYALHQLPCGVLSPGKLNVVANGAVLDPPGLLEEIDGLASRGVHLLENLRISDRAHLVMPWHRMEDRLREGIAARRLGSSRSTGATGKGIGPCYADKASRDTALRVADLFRPKALAARLAHIVEFKNAVLAALADLADLAGEAFAPFRVEPVLRDLEAFSGRVGGYVADTTGLLEAEMARGRRVLFEGANAALLDVDHGTYPYVTSSNSSALGIPAGSGIPGARVERVVGVVKAYTSRVGSGPFPTEIQGEPARSLRERGREFGTTTGRPRRVGWLDLSAVRRTAKLSGVTGLALTGLSVLAGIGSIRVADGWRRGQETLDRLPASAETVEELQPVYEDLPGFPGPISGTCRFEDLPDGAIELVTRLESAVAPVEIVCTGPGREEVLRRR